jgi:hypothetical protein
MGLRILLLAFVIGLSAVGAEGRALANQVDAASTPDQAVQPAGDEGATAACQYYEVEYYCHGSWRSYGCYSTYSAACQASNYLRRCGYCTRIWEYN